MKLNKKSPMPIYHQLYGILKEKIINGEYQTGSYLPSESKLAEIFKVSRLTVREALSELVEEGFIEKKRGRGSIVVMPKNVENLTGLHSFTQDAKLRNHLPGSLVIENKLVDVPPYISEKLNLPIGSKMVLLKRLRLLDNIPYAIEWAYINPLIDTRILNVLEIDMSENSLYEFFKHKLNIKLIYADETLEVAHASQEAQKLLKITMNSCVVLRKRFTYIEGNRCIEYVQSLYRGDKYRFTVRLYEK